ncbi:MAG: hypothetical protein HC934_12480 [Acaryochloridaceae cyanobacterium SU_2_1]|nr:hypothetical protein [Acaryochloridaceae cyanobacterium SU_2_1]NJN39381.1 hypothetical protein [Acaryochloridaceae cyanobacterium CSU_3_4]
MTYCPVEREGRIIITSTPLFAKQVSSKLSYGSAREVQRDLGDHHHRLGAVSYLQRISEAVVRIIKVKEESRNYQRLRCSGMRWKETGAAVVLSLRTLVLTPI